MNRKIEHNKLISDFKKKARIKECFHFNHEECNGDIISAHSIQRSGRLSLLEEDIKGNKVIYTTLFRDIDEQGNVIGFKELGKKEASTFFGFCKHHDTIIFREIENYHTSVITNKFCFLNSYRSFAHEYHAKQEVLQGFKVDSPLTINIPFREQHINGLEVGLRDMLTVKNRLNQLLHNEKYSELIYFAYSFEGFYPVACSTSFSPEYSLSNIELNKSIDPSFIYETVMLTVLPGLESSTVIFACLPEHESSILFIDELRNIHLDSLKHITSSLMISYVENTFFSPSVWSLMSPDEKSDFMTDLNNTSPVKRNTYTGFYHCKPNLGGLLVFVN